EEHTLIAEKYFKKSKFSKNIIQHVGKALDIIPKINKRFQLAFIDADKENYSKYFDLLIDKIDVNGIIIADNVLWSGKVTKKHMDNETQELDLYNKKVNSDLRVENILLSVRDGLMICRKIS
ncbi:MAG: methyltransferase, partial [Flavobacteriales bacterium]|nr:methyltransferase [Flavobacteriales bacterium]